MADPAVVIGGGLAGTAAALRLADAGRDVVLLESRPALGGRASSFRRGTLEVDTGQHVFLRCCTAYRALLARLGADGQVSLQPRLDIPVLAPGGVTSRLARTPALPAPLHLAAAVAGYRHLRPAQRLRAASALLALRGLDPASADVDARSFGQFLRAHGQGDAAVERLWGVIGTATLNRRPDEASLALAATVFRTGLLERADAADLGYAAVPLAALHDRAARRALADAGVEVRTSWRVESVDPAGAATARVVARPRGTSAAPAHGAQPNTAGQSWVSGTVVLAVPPAAAFALAPALRATPAAPAEQLGTSPIVNVHVRFDRRVTDLPFAAGVGTPVQWFFDRTAPAGAHGDAGQYLAVTVSAAEDVVDVPTRELGARFVAELARLLPDSAHARVTDLWVTRERDATFCQAPGTARLRPGPADGPPGVWLAGAWTATGWPDSMESAVRSGEAAAAAALGSRTDDQEAAA